MAFQVSPSDTSSTNYNYNYNIQIIRRTLPQCQAHNRTSNPSDDMKESIRRIVRRTVAESQRRPRVVRLTESGLRRLVRESVIEYRRKKDNMRKNTIRLTESQVRTIVRESVRRVLSNR